ncbi:MAG: amidinotransferase [Daejeonella sp.]|nr:amidinotransferase [Daejeonella sp.]
MIRPVCCGFNEQTAESNAFQLKQAGDTFVQEQALAEFDAFVDILKNNALDVIVIEDNLENHTPDSIFPNNWISLQEDGTIYLFPMEAPNRRLERRNEILDVIKKSFSVTKIIDLSFFESQNKFLEGTGSMILDHEHKLAYACISSRTNPEVLEYYCDISGYKPVTFHAVDQTSKPIYHTNVMMCMGQKFVVICLEAITDEVEREKVLLSLSNTGKEIVRITLDQMYQFAGNMLELKNKSGENLLVMSERAYKSLDNNQLEILKRQSKIIYSPLTTIENNGGGSARCMIAEVFLYLK